MACPSRAVITLSRHMIFSPYLASRRLAAPPQRTVASFTITALM